MPQYLYSARPGRSILLRAAALVTALSLLALPRVAQAGPSELPAVTDDPDDETKEDPQLERAMKAYELGQAAYNAADYEAALGHFQEAASLYGSPDFQYNIGLCYEKLDKPEEAIRAFEVYLRAKPNAEDRAQVEDRIEEQRQILATKEQGGSKEAPDGDDRDPPPPPPENDGRALVISGAVLLGVGAALGLAGGLGFGVAAKRRSDDLEDVQSGGNPGDVTFAEAQDLESEGKRFETLQIATAAVGAAIGITGVVLLAIGLKRKQAAAGTSALRFSPHVGKGTAGLSLGGRF
jgi:tetratricopeptide (TPR) repeat protein